jgi:DNA polymerase-1
MPASTLHNRHEFAPTYRQHRAITAAYPYVWSGDSETFLIGAALLAPPMVCLSTDDAHQGPRLHHAKFDRAQVLEAIRRPLRDGALIIGLNIAYDMAVFANEFPELLPLIFEAYENDRIVDVSTAQQLLDIAQGCFRGRYDGTGKWIEYGYGLDDLVLRWFGVVLDKEKHRLEYGTLIDTPVPLWSEGARKYPMRDAAYPRAIWDRMDVPANQGALTDVFRQSRAAWWLHLMTVWGFAVDGAHVSELKRRMLIEHDVLAGRLRTAGLLKWNDKRDTKAAMARMVFACAARGIEVKKTDTGEICLDEEACLDTKDAILKDYARFTSVVNVLNKDIAALEPAVKLNVPVQSRFHGLVETGRVSCSGGAKKSKKAAKSNVVTFQLHNVRREPGVRESFIGRPGTLLLSCDYVMFELCTWAQVCMKICGFSELGKALNARRDVHLDLGSQILGISYEEAVARKTETLIKDARQMSKPGNFGFPGGMGWRAFQGWVKANYGMVLNDAQAQMLHAAWKARWKEHKPYFDFIGNLVGRGDSGIVTHLFSDRPRAGVPYTVACNSYFQGLAADCAKDAGFRLAKACYVDESSPLYGCRIVNFIHDEFILEVPIARAHECSMEVVRLMEEAGKLWCPDVPPRAEPALMECWMKAAEPVWADQRLIAWTPDIGETLKAHAKGDVAKVLQLWPKLKPIEQRAMAQAGVRLAA